MRKTQLQEIFNYGRVVGIPGVKSSGKTNNIIALITEFREANKKTPVYFFGMNVVTSKYLRKLGCDEISGFDQMINKENCIIVCDEFTQLHLNDVRYKDDLNLFMTQIHHHNIYVILSSPSIRSFNSVIGGEIDVWLLKTVKLSQCINGSQLKKIITDYNNSKYKNGRDLRVAKDELLLKNDDKDVIIKVPYIAEVDAKVDQEDILVTEKNPGEITEEKNMESPKKLSRGDE